MLPIQHAAAPTILAFALRDERLLVGFADSTIALFDTGPLFSEGNQPIDPLSTFSNTGNQGPLLQIHSNPGDLVELVLILRESLNLDHAAVEVLDVQESRFIGGWKCGPAGAPTCGEHRFL